MGTFPIKKGSTSVSVELSLSAMLPGALATTETTVTATATDGGNLFCMDIKSAPAVDELIDKSSSSSHAIVPAPEHSAHTSFSSAASAAELALTWADCGGSNTHTKIT